MAWELLNVLRDYLVGGEYKNYYVTLLNDYYPFGLLFWMVGMAIFLILQYKTRNFAFSGAVTSFYFIVISSSGLITGLYTKMVMQWFGAILGVLVGYYIYKTIKG